MSTAITQQVTGTLTVTATGAPGRPGVIWDPAGWREGIAYSLDAGLYHRGSTWRAIAAHISTADTEPGVGSAWQEAWQILALGAEPERLSEAIAAADIAMAAKNDALAAAATAEAARDMAAAHAGTAAESALAAAAHAAPIGLLISDSVKLPDGGWHVCRDYHMTARFDRLRLEVLFGQGDAGQWFIEADGVTLAGPIALTSAAPVIRQDLGLELEPGTEVIAWHAGGDLAPPFAVLLQIDGRA